MLGCVTKYHVPWLHPRGPFPQPEAAAQGRGGQCSEPVPTVGTRPGLPQARPRLLPPGASGDGPRCPLPRGPGPGEGPPMTLTGASHTLFPRPRTPPGFTVCKIDSRAQGQRKAAAFPEGLRGHSHTIRRHKAGLSLSNESALHRETMEPQVHRHGAPGDLRLLGGAVGNVKFPFNPTRPEALHPLLRGAELSFPLHSGERETISIP